MMVQTGIIRLEEVKVLHCVRLAVVVVDLIGHPISPDKPNRIQCRFLPSLKTSDGHPVFERCASKREPILVLSDTFRIRLAIGRFTRHTRPDLLLHLPVSA